MCIRDRELRAWSDAALPRWGKGRCWVRRRRCLPRWGKGAAVWRAWFWLVRGEMLFMRRFALQEGLAGAPGGRGKTALRIRAHPSRAGRRARSKGGRGALRARRKLPALPATASFSQPSRGETGGLCPHPPKGPVPWVSLFGEPGHLPRLPVSPSPQTPQAASPCSWTCRRLYPHRPTRNAKKHPCPLLVGHGCVVTEPKALAAGTAGPKALAAGTAGPS